MIFIKIDYLDTAEVAQEVWFSEKYMILPTALGTKEVEPRLSGIPKFVQQGSYLNNNIIHKHNYKFKISDQDVVIYNLLSDKFLTNSTVTIYEIDSDLITYKKIGTGKLNKIKYDSEIELNVEDVNLFQLKNTNLFIDTDLKGGAVEKYSGKQKPTAIGKLDGIKCIQTEILNDQIWNDITQTCTISSQIVSYLDDETDPNSQFNSELYYVLNFTTQADAEAVRLRLNTDDKIQYFVNGKEAIVKVVNVFDTRISKFMSSNQIFVSFVEGERAYPSGSVAIKYKSSKNSVSENEFYISKTTDLAYNSFTISSLQLLSTDITIVENIDYLNVDDVIIIECLTLNNEAYSPRYSIKAIDYTNRIITLRNNIPVPVMNDYTGIMKTEKINKIKINNKIYRNEPSFIDVNLQNITDFKRERIPLTVQLEGLKIIASHALTVTNDIIIKFTYANAPLTHTWTTSGSGVKQLELLGVFDPLDLGPLTQTMVMNYINGLSITGLTISATISTPTANGYVSPGSAYDLKKIITPSFIFRSENNLGQIIQFFVWFNLKDSLETFYQPSFVGNSTYIQIDYLPTDNITQVQASFASKMDTLFNVGTYPFLFSEDTVIIGQNTVGTGRYHIRNVYNTKISGLELVSNFIGMSSYLTNSITSYERCEAYILYDGQEIRVILNKNNIKFLNKDVKAYISIGAGLTPFGSDPSFIYRSFNDLGDIKSNVDISDGDVAVVSSIFNQYSTNDTSKFIGVSDISEKFDYSNNSYYLLKEAILDATATVGDVNALIFKDVNFKDTFFYYVDANNTLSSLITKACNTFNTNVINNNIPTLKNCGIFIDDDKELYKSLLKINNNYNTSFYIDENGLINSNFLNIYSNTNIKNLSFFDTISIRLQDNFTNLKNINFKNKFDYSIDNNDVTTEIAQLSPALLAKLDETTKDVLLNISDKNFVNTNISGHTFKEIYAQRYLRDNQIVTVIMKSNVFNSKLFDTVTISDHNRIPDTRLFYITRIKRNSDLVELELLSFKIPSGNFLVDQLGNFLVDQSGNFLVSN